MLKQSEGGLTLACCGVVAMGWKKGQGSSLPACLPICLSMQVWVHLSIHSSSHPHIHPTSLPPSIHLPNYHTTHPFHLSFFHLPTLRPSIYHPSTHSSTQPCLNPSIYPPIHHPPARPLNPSPSIYPSSHLPPTHPLNLPPSIHPFIHHTIHLPAIHPFFLPPSIIQPSSSPIPCCIKSTCSFFQCISEQCHCILSPTEVTTLFLFCLGIFCIAPGIGRQFFPPLLKFVWRQSCWLPHFPLLLFTSDDTVCFYISSSCSEG